MTASLGVSKRRQHPTRAAVPKEEYNRTHLEPVVNRGLMVVLIAALAASANAQVALSPAETAVANRVLDGEPAGERLRCTIERKDPSLDFEFRFTAGFTIECPLKVFEGRRSTVRTFVRVTPAGGTPVVLGGTGDLPAVPAEMAARTDPRKVNTDLQFSGTFTLGEGRSCVERSRGHPSSDRDS